MKSLKKITAALIAALLLCGAAFAAGESPADANQTVIKVFETTDIHGYLMDTSSMNEDTFTYRMAFIANEVNSARSDPAYDDVLLLNGGNNYEGTPVSNLLRGAAVRAAMDAMGYDATALGNHEFDWDAARDYLHCDAEGTLAAYDVGTFSGDPDIPVLACNLYYADTGERVDWTRDYVITEKAGHTVALIGYITDFSSQVMTTRIEPYTIDDSIEHLNARIEEINRAENPDITIVVAFGGASALAAALDPAQVDLVTGGHNQASAGSAGTADNGIVYLESACYAQGYVSALITIDELTGEVRVTAEEPTAVTASGPGADNSRLYAANAEGKLDPTVLAISQAAWECVSADMEEDLGYVDTDLSTRVSVSDNGATAAGNWITGLMLRWARETYGEDVAAAFYNNGGMRASLTLAAGETTRRITAADVYTINPFCNYWYVYEITGSELAQHLLNAFDNGNYGNELSGLTFTYSVSEASGTGETSADKDAGAPGGKSGAVYTIESITLDDGTVVDIHDETTTYLVCTSSYSGTLAGGVFASHEPLNETEAPIDNQTLIELLRAESAANNGYITVDTGARGTEINGE